MPNISPGLHEWFLESEGKKVGPFTADQVHAFFRDGQITGEHRVTSESLLGEWSTVELLVRALGETTREIRRIAAFQPPPRPVDLMKLAPRAFSDEPTLMDATDGLFAALKTSRERQLGANRPSTTPYLPPPVSIPVRRHYDLKTLLALVKRIPTQAYLVAALSLVLVFGMWGLVRLLQRPLDPSTKGVPIAAQQPARPAPPPQAFRQPAATAGLKFPRTAPPPRARSAPLFPRAPVVVNSPPPAEQTREEPADNEAQEREMAAMPVGDWRATSGGAPPDELRADPPPPGEGVISQMAREQGVALESPPGDRSQDNPTPEQPSDADATPPENN